MFELAVYLLTVSPRLHEASLVWNLSQPSFSQDLVLLSMIERDLEAKIEEGLLCVKDAGDLISGDFPRKIAKILLMGRRVQISDG